MKNGVWGHIRRTPTVGNASGVDRLPVSLRFSCAFSESSRGGGACANFLQLAITEWSNDHKPYKPKP